MADQNNNAGGLLPGAVPDCLFCKIAAGQIPAVKVYEDDRILAFMDINPINDGHLLVIPRHHADGLLDIAEEDLQRVALVAQGLARIIRREFKPEGLNIVQSNGQAAGQIVPHFHLHLIPRKPEDRLTKLMNWGLEPGDMDKINEVAKKIKSRIG